MKLLTVLELKEELRISLRSAYRLIQQPGFPVCRVGGKILVPEDKLQAWLDNGGTAGQEPPERRWA